MRIGYLRFRFFFHGGIDEQGRPIKNGKARESGVPYSPLEPQQ